MKKITCVIDNSVLRSSNLWGEHGLSFLIATDHGCVLFDTGRSGSVLLHNLDVLEMNPKKLNAIILSHAHNDHTGGLEALLKQKPGLPVYASPDIFQPRFSLHGHQYKSIGMSLNAQELNQISDLRLNHVPEEVFPDLMTTGEIVERLEMDGRSDQHFIPQGKGWKPDPYRDDISMVMDTSDGLILICGCCHAGLLNTLAHVRKKFQRPIIGILGGTHLVTANEANLRYVVNVLYEDYKLVYLHLNHCTGDHAFVALVNTFGDRVSTCPAGTTYNFY